MRFFKKYKVTQNHPGGYFIVSVADDLLDIVLDNYWEKYLADSLEDAESFIQNHKKEKKEKGTKKNQFVKYYA